MEVKTAGQLIKELKKLNPNTQVCVKMETAKSIREWLKDWNEEFNDGDVEKQRDNYKKTAVMTDDKLLHDFAENFNELFLDESSLGCEAFINACLGIIDKN